jgi:IS1 family transposase
MQITPKAGSLFHANSHPELKAAGEQGDAWLWVATDADTKLVPAWLVGSRDAECANDFIADLAERLVHRIQLTSDGHKPYLEAVEGAFGADVDYAMLVKSYGETSESAKSRYSPAECTGAKKVPVEGKPDHKHISTSYAERNNLNIRMHSRRMTRLTNAFSKKMENHAHAMSLHFMYYNFVRIHKTLRTTPAMAAGVSKKLWEMSDVVDMLEVWESKR